MTQHNITLTIDNLDHFVFEIDGQIHHMDRSRLVELRWVADQALNISQYEIDAAGEAQ